MITVIEFSYRAGRRKQYWKYRCDCGVEKTIESSKLGIQISCGCQSAISTSNRKRIHGMSKSRFYGIWNDMMMRCYNPNKERYNRYGGRGISVCIRWHSFYLFYKDMFSSYRDGLSLERKIVNGNYNIENCVWIPKAEQALNKERTIWMTINGEKKYVREWANISGTKIFTIYSRRKKGWTPYECVFGKKTK